MIYLIIIYVNATSVVSRNWLEDLFLTTFSEESNRDVDANSDDIKFTKTLQSDIKLNIDGIVKNNNFNILRIM